MSHSYFISTCSANTGEGTNQQQNIHNVGNDVLNQQISKLTQSQNIQQHIINTPGLPLHFSVHLSALNK
ncbi:MAG: hypothetical protein DLM72_10000 [Candidatus Nitrosopolaris wilkensis]|nr:MAG: hypothetical protein DLM72_10000 [Candidatus Nitrosopolaris wilkensis]